MIALVQRAGPSRVEAAGAVVGRIERGFVVLLGVGKDDGESEAGFLAKKIAELRVFEDDCGKMNRTVVQIRGAVLVVPQFTLMASLRRGRRPDFLHAAQKPLAEPLFEFFVRELQSHDVAVATGRFGATMQVHLVNQGPATFILDSTVLMDRRKNH